VLRRLIDDLRSCGPLERAARDVEALLGQSLREWPGAAELVSKAGAYTRTCAYRGAQFEVLLLNWAPGSVSAIHDHGDQHCWMMLLDGRLHVDDYVRLDSGQTPGYAEVEPCGYRVLEPGELDVRAGRFDLHRVAAPHDAGAVSLHLYSGPLRNFLIYDEPARRCASVRGTYDAVLSSYSAPVHR
jgi:cysteine dioxygenase